MDMNETSSATGSSFIDIQERLCNAVEDLTYQLKMQNQIIADYLVHNMENYLSLRNNGETDIENTITKLKKLKDESTEG